jgi:hypothetical protein
MPFIQSVFSSNIPASVGIGGENPSRPKTPGTLDGQRADIPIGRHGPAAVATAHTCACDPPVLHLQSGDCAAEPQMDTERAQVIHPWIYERLVGGQVEDPVDRTVGVQTEEVVEHPLDYGADALGACLLGV